MRAGALRHKITIYERTDTRDSDTGGYAESYSEYITTRAEVRFLSGSEVLQNEAIANTTTIQVIMRYRSGIAETMEVQYDGDRYNIRVIEQNARKTMLKLTCSKIVN